MHSNCRRPHDSQSYSTDLQKILELNNKFVPKVSQIDLGWLARYRKEAEIFDVYGAGAEVLGFIVECCRLATI